jgi:hypothetical protein
VHDEGVLVPALVPAESQIRQGYFLFCVGFCAGARPVALRPAEVALTPRAAAFRRGAAGAVRFFTPAARDLAAAGAGAGAAGVGNWFGFRGSGAERFGSTVDRCTSVNRVWSPIV